jgi:hypothetical protein
MCRLVVSASRRSGEFVGGQFPVRCAERHRRHRRGRVVAGDLGERHRSGRHGSGLRRSGLNRTGLRRAGDPGVHVG